MKSGDDQRLDPGKVASLYFKHSDDIRAFLLGVLRDRELADEALQTTFTRTIEAGHTAREESIRGWLFRVAYNEAMAIRRRQNLDRRSLPQLAGRRSESSESGFDRACRVETVARVKEALNSLPDDQRQVVIKRIYEGLKFDEIAGELNLPLGTVLTRMRLALKKLSGRLTRDE